MGSSVIQKHSTCFGYQHFNILLRTLFSCFFFAFFFRFQCEKLVLVGDPKQLPPTIQGSESVHEQGLEQTLFDRLCLMVGAAKHAFGKGGEWNCRSPEVTCGILVHVAEDQGFTIAKYHYITEWFGLEWISKVTKSTLPPQTGTSSSRPACSKLHPREFFPVLISLSFLRDTTQFFFGHSTAVTLPSVLLPTSSSMTGTSLMGFLRRTGLLYWNGFQHSASIALMAWSKSVPQHFLCILLV